MDDVKELIYSSLAMAALSHHWHLTITGPGSYAAHVTLGDLYPYCHEIADTLGEKLQGAGEILPPSKAKISIPFSAPEMDNICQTVERFAEEFEGIKGPPWLTNITQEIQGQLYNFLYKLRRLS